MAESSIEKEMFFGAKPDIFEKARHLRNNTTENEQQLWKRINKRKILGCKFRRQHPIDIFIADFYCHEIKLVIEVDGGIHMNSEQKAYDLGRTAEIEQFDIEVIRFSNEEIEKEIDGCIKKLIEKCVLRKEYIDSLPPIPL